MRMRTLLLLCLFSVSFGLTALSLLIVHTILEKQIRRDIVSDLHRSIMTFRNMQVQRRNMLQREAALLADLPSLKSLMTAPDTLTIQDAGAEFFRVSGSDFFALADRNSHLVALYETNGPSMGIPRIASAEANRVFLPEEPNYVLNNGRLYEVSSQPLYLGPPQTGTLLGYVAVGYLIDSRVAREVSEASAAEVIFKANNNIVATTLDQPRWQEFTKYGDGAFHAQETATDLWLGREHYVGATVPLAQNNDHQVQLVVLKSYDEAAQYLRRLDQLLVVLGLCVLFAGAVIAVYISSTITRPLDSLVAGARALGAGDFHYHFQSRGARELQELGVAFDRMRMRLEQARKELIEAERLATIGRMASSISHDLRHYLSAVYANAEFLGYESTNAAERAELLAEVRLGVEGMLELIDSLLIFSRTGQSLQPGYESLALIAERAITLVRAHRDTQGIAITWDALPQIEVWLDVRKIERAIYNLLLNACQAAKNGADIPAVHLAIAETPEWINISIQDNGPGVPESIRVTLFQPFVSEGKQAGIGLGLTIANRIAEEHGGSVTLVESQPGRTIFNLSLSKAMLNKIAESAQEKHPATLLPHN